MASEVYDIEIKSFLGKSMYKLSREIAPLRIKNISIILDSRNSASTDPIYNYRSTWDFTYDGLVRPGVVTTLKKIYNIVGMRMFNTSLNTPALYSYAAPNPIYTNTFTFLIEELKTQSFITHGKYFHFIGAVASRTYINKIVIDFEKYNHGFFWFYKPVQELTKLTISVGNPIYPYSFEEDSTLGRLDLVSTPGTTIITIINFPLTIKVGQTIALQLVTFDPIFFSSLPLEVQNMFAPNIYTVTADLGGNNFSIDAPYYPYPDLLLVVILYPNTSYRIPLEFYFIDDTVDAIEEYEDRHQYDPSVGELGENAVLELLGIKDTATLYKELAPAVYYRKQYLYFDARYAQSIKDNKITWLYDAYNVRDGTVNSPILLRDIVAMRIYQFIWRDYNKNTRPIDTLWVGVSPITNQAMIMEEKRPHFMLSCEEVACIFRTTGVRLDWISDPKYYNWGEYKFNSPIMIRDQLALSFWYSYRSSGMLPYIFDFWTTGSVLLTSYATGLLLFTTPSSLVFPINGIVYIRGFSTTSATIDKNFINYVNRIEGHTYNFGGFGQPYIIYMKDQWDYNITISGAVDNAATEISSQDDNVAISIEFTYQKRTPGYDIDDLGDEVRTL